MNDKIRELYRKAVVNHGFDYLPTPTLEKFAELIIAECCDICEHKGDAGLDGHYCVDEIKKHFGVK